MSSLRLALFTAAIAGLLSPAGATAPLYRVTLAAPATLPAAVVRDLRWQCAGATCTAPLKATSADATVCAAVVRRFGPVTAFAAGARELPAEAIERCNAAAR